MKKKLSMIGGHSTNQKQDLSALKTNLSSLKMPSSSEEAQQPQSTNIEVKIPEIFDNYWEPGVPTPDEFIAEFKANRAEKKGEGKFGEVFRVFGKFAVKRSWPMEENNIAFREVNTFRKINNPFSLKYLGAFKFGTCVYIVMDYVDCGSLGGIIKKKLRVPEKILSQMTFQLLCLFKYLQESKIMHRDIKPDNILLSSKGIVKVGDYGLSKQSPEGNFVTYMGTELYMSPERNGGKTENYTYSADIWSLGLTIAEMAIAEFPLNQSLLMNPFATQNYFPKIEDELKEELKEPTTGLSDELIEFITLCVKFVPKDRADPDKLLNTKFIKLYNPKAKDILTKVTTLVKTIDKQKQTPLKKGEILKNFSEIEGLFPDVEKWIAEEFMGFGNHNKQSGAPASVQNEEEEFEF